MNVADGGFIETWDWIVDPDFGVVFRGSQLVRNIES